jgi:hypothetical protein
MKRHKNRGNRKVGQKKNDKKKEEKKDAIKKKPEKKKTVKKPKPDSKPTKDSKIDLFTSKNIIKETFSKMNGDKADQKDKGRIAFSLISEKPVYQPGESVEMSVFIYDKSTKKPVSSNLKAFNNSLLVVEIKDANDGKVAKLTGKVDESVGVISYSYQTLENFKGGFYKIEATYQSVLVDKTKFFVTSVREKRNAVTLDVNKDALTANDEVIGKVSLRMLTKGEEFFEKGAPGESLNYSVKIMDQNFNEMENLKKKLTQGTGMFSFHTPRELKQITDIIILVEITVEGETLEVSRQVSVKTLNDLHIRFVSGNGKYVVGLKNEIYFACFAGENEKVSMAMNQGKVIERFQGGMGTEEEVVSNISSNEDGRGKFLVKLKKNKEYIFEVKEGLKTKKFLIWGKQNEESLSQVSDTMMSLSKKVLKWEENFEVTLKKRKKESEKTYKVIVMDKLDLKLITTFKMNDKEMTKEINMKKAKLSNGGVYTVQLYHEGNAGEALQESLIYVEPRNKLDIELSFNQQKYAPKDNVEFEVKIKGDQEGLVGIVVSDETPYLEIEKRNYPVSLCSKVFLEKELYFKSKEWVNSCKYVDSFFENNPKKDTNPEAEADLEYLLGIQDWRLFFLTEKNVKEFVSSKKKTLNDSLTYLLGYSSEAIKEIYFPPPKRTKKFKGRGMRRANLKRKMKKMVLCKKAAPKKGLQRSKQKAISEMESFAEESEESEDDGDDIGEQVQNEDEQEEKKNEIEEELKKEIEKAKTVFWSRFKKTKNKAFKGGFELPDLVKTFRVSIISMNMEGVYGTYTTEVTVSKPFNIVLESPLYIRPNETVACKMILENNKDQDIKVDVPTLNRQIEIPKRGVYNVEFDVNQDQIPYSITVNETTEMSHTNKVVMPLYQGLTYEKSQAMKLQVVDSNKKSKKITLELPEDIVPGSLNLNIEYKQISANVLLKGLKNMIREPCGCFEQTSSTTFPLVMLIRYIDSLKEKPESMLSMRIDAEEKMKRGIKRLLGYECSQGGFEWFGNNPGHVTLTAYGIWQFIEMNKIGNYIDVKVIDRTLDWLRKKYQKDKAQFEMKGSGYDSFARPPQFCSDIYILFILTLMDDYNINYKSIVSHKIQNYEANKDSSKRDHYLESFVALVYSGK